MSIGKPALHYSGTPVFPLMHYSDLYMKEFLPFVERPARYIGNEINSVIKDWDSAKLKVALVFPDVYEIGISHLGLKILYQILNSLPDVLAERCYSPWTDAEKILREKNIPLCSLENCRPLNEFDIVAFSIQYELCYTNLLAILDLAGIPLRSAQRWNSDNPLVIAGGCVYSPGPLEPFIDAFALGDGENTVQRIADWALKKKSENSFKTCLNLVKTLVESVPGIYAPALYENAIANDPARRLYHPKIKNFSLPFPVQKEIVEDFSGQSDACSPIVPFCEAVHDRAQIEVMRGCARGCRFCQAGMVTRPVREKAAAAVVAEALEVTENSGFEEITLASLSAGDYSQIAAVLRKLFEPEVFPTERTAVALPSLRLDSFDAELADKIKRVRKTSFTFAPEAGSERLRKVINKSLTHNDIIKTAESVFNSGWKGIKIYFMIGLPAETMKDIEEMVQLVKNIIDLKQNIKVNMSVSTFVPKTFTPFQWEKFANVDDILEKQKYILQHLPKRRVKISFHKLGLSRLEAVFARGDKKLADVIEKAYMLGCRFDDWSERLDESKWAEAFKETGINPENYLKGIPEESPLPWDVLDFGVTKEFLLKEKHNAEKEIETPFCLKNKCVNCGVNIKFKC